MPSPGLDLMPGFIPARKIQKPKKNLNQYFSCTFLAGIQVQIRVQYYGKC